MKFSFLLVSLTLTLLISSTASAAGLARSDNFMVMAESQPLADDVLKSAEAFRREVAIQWLGTPLPASVGPAIIHVELSDDRDDGFTWAIDGRQRKYHSVYLTTSKRRALGSTLKHEITHVVLATRFPSRLPVWLEEGCAGFADDVARLKSRREILDWYARTGNWPDLESVLKATRMTASDRASYAVACSITEFLIERGGQDNLMAFAELVQQQGFQPALKKLFGFNSVADLSKHWQGWVSARHALASNSQQKTR